MGTRKVLVAGGQSVHMQGMFQDNLRPHGVEIGWVYGGGSEKNSFNGIPQGCEGVLIIRDYIGHLLSGKVIRAAKEANLPLAIISRKWAVAEPILRMQGILAPATAPPDKVKIKALNVQPAAVEYICNERNWGRIPRRAEVEAALRRAYGPKIPFPNREYSKAAREAAELVPRPGMYLAQKNDAEDITLSVIEDDPLLLAKKDSEILEYVRTFGDVDENFTQKALDGIRARLLNAATKVKNNAKHPDVQFRIRLVRQAARRAYTAFKDGGPWPSEMAGLIKKAMLIPPQSYVLQDIRREVLGEKAVILKNAPQCQSYLSKRLPSAVFKDLAESGLIWAVLNKGRWLSSYVAIDAYVAAKMAPVAVVTPTEPPPVQEEAPDAGVAVPTPEPTPPEPKAPDSTEGLLFVMADLLEEQVGTKVAGIVEGAMTQVFQRLTAIEQRLANLECRPAQPMARDTIQDVIDRAEGAELRLTFGACSNPKGDKTPSDS